MAIRLPGGVKRELPDFTYSYAPFGDHDNRTMTKNGEADEPNDWQTRHKPTSARNHRSGHFPTAVTENWRRHPRSSELTQSTKGGAQEQLREENSKHLVG